jgi:hypothetical protein
MAGIVKAARGGRNEPTAGATSGAGRDPKGT